MSNSHDFCETGLLGPESIPEELSDVNPTALEAAHVMLADLRSKAPDSTDEQWDTLERNYALRLQRNADATGLDVAVFLPSTK